MSIQQKHAGYIDRISFLPSTYIYIYIDIHIALLYFSVAYYEQKSPNISKHLRYVFVVHLVSPRPGWNCISTCRGHGCRVWDAVLAPIKEPHGTPWKEGWCIVSASEDSVVRIYSLQGMVLRELQGAKLMDFVVFQGCWM